MIAPRRGQWICSTHQLATSAKGVDCFRMVKVILFLFAKAALALGFGVLILALL
jgi:hypothetical protein